MKETILLVLIIACLSCKNEKKQKELINRDVSTEHQFKEISSPGIIEPVKWTTAVEKISNTEYDLILKATIEPNYHLYSQNIPDNGPRPTVFVFEKNGNFELIGNTTEEKGHTVFDPTFKMKIKYFDTEVIFKQKVKVKNIDSLKISGEIEFMTCNDANCVLGYDDFEFTL